MAEEEKEKMRLEIAHVLFIDIVDYSKLLIDEQSEALQELNQIVRNTEAACEAESSGRFIILPTGDGMALVFTASIAQPVECAVQIGQALRAQPSLPVRMGIHSGPVHHVADVNQRENIAGAGINMAQRVMDCGDAGHILVSKRVADDLAQYRRWQPYLHELGDIEVKHGVEIPLVNVYGDNFGNRESPRKFQEQKKHRTRIKWGAIAAGLIALVMIATGAALYSHYRTRSLTAPEKSIAVLPFENLSDDKQNAYFADGVQDEILTDLAKVADLKVISRTSVASYTAGSKRNIREIAQALGVAHVLEGSVRRADGKVRVNAQLIDARTDAHLWAENYDGRIDDVFAIQTDIARTIADQLQAKLSPSEKAAIEKPPTSDSGAYDVYLRAQLLFAGGADPEQAREKLTQAEHLLNEAVTRDPRFLVAWCLLARVHSTFYWLGLDHTPDRLDHAKAAVQAALRVDPDSGEGHLALADFYYHDFRDYERARGELAIARRTLPNNPLVFEYTGYIARREGHWDEATRNLERALELDPRNFLTLQQLALIYLPQHRYEDEIRTYDRALAITPGDPATRILRAEVQLNWRADIKPAIAMLATLIAEDPTVASDVDDPDVALCERNPASAARALNNYPRDGVVVNGVNVSYAFVQGEVAHCLGDSAAARTAFTTARSEVEQMLLKEPDFAAALSLLGIIDAGLGRKGEAMSEGRRACKLLPISKDAVDGPALAINLAQIYSWLGEKDLAIDEIAAVERVPCQLHYGDLKLHPNWDPLRGDPRFEKIVASLAPKD